MHRWNATSMYFVRIKNVIAKQKRITICGKFLKSYGCTSSDSWLYIFHTDVSILYILGSKVMSRFD